MTRYMAMRLLHLPRSIQVTALVVFSVSFLACTRRSNYRLSVSTATISLFSVEGICLNCIFGHLISSITKNSMTIFRCIKEHGLIKNALSLNESSTLPNKNHCGNASKNLDVNVPAMLKLFQWNQNLVLSTLQRVQNSTILKL